jgi:hypothetical protein
MLECKMAQNHVVVRTPMMKTPTHTHINAHVHIYIYICRFSAMFGGGKKNNLKKKLSASNPRGIHVDLRHVFMIESRD